MKKAEEKSTYEKPDVVEFNAFCAFTYYTEY